MNPETKELLGQLQESVGKLLRNPQLSWRWKVAFFVVAPPLSVAGAAAFGVRHYLLEAKRLLRQSDGD